MIPALFAYHWPSFLDGESPNVGGVSAFFNAVNDAFAHLRPAHTAMPHDHWRVWKTAQSLGLTAG